MIATSGTIYIVTRCYQSSNEPDRSDENVAWFADPLAAKDFANALEAKARKIENEYRSWMTTSPNPRPSDSFLPEYAEPLNRWYSARHIEIERLKQGADQHLAIDTWSWPSGAVDAFGDPWSVGRPSFAIETLERGGTA